MRSMTLAGGAFEEPRRALTGGEIDWSKLDLSAHDDQLVARARSAWAERAQSEYRSVQIMARFLEESLAAGDPLDVHAAAADLIADEVRHALLCREVCVALGGAAPYPDPLPEPLPEPYRRAPMAERALTTALSTLAVSETISVAFVEDLAARCPTPGISDVLKATIADEDTHQDLGWSYVEASLARFPKSTLPSWRHLVTMVLAPHRAAAERALAELTPDRRRLEAQPDAAEAALGLFSPARQALVFEAAWRERLAPRLARLELLV